MITSSEAVGTWLALQLEATFRLVLVLPVQVFCASVACCNSTAATRRRRIFLIKDIFCDDRIYDTSWLQRFFGSAPVINIISCKLLSPGTFYYSQLFLRYTFLQRVKMKCSYS